MARGGQLIELRRRHLPAMLALRASTHREHWQRQPQVFVPEADPASMLRDLARFVPGWNPFTVRHRYGIGWEAEGTLRAHLLYSRAVTGAYHFRSKNVLFVDEIAVEADWQGRGIARQLLAELGNRAEREGVDEIAAVIWAGNEASAGLFEATGFAVEHCRFTRQIGADGNAARGA